MTTSIGQTSTGSIFVGGTASGLDTAALIDAAVAQRTISAERLGVEIDENIEVLSAYSELETLIDAVESALGGLRGNPGIFDDNDTVFEDRSGSVTTSDGSDFSSILDIAIESDAVVGSYSLEVTQLAEAQQVIGTSVADQDADLGYVGTFDIGLSGGATATINVTADQSLAEVAAAINAESETSGVAASVLKVSENEYQLVLTGQETNRTIDVTGVTGDDVLNLVGVTDGLGGFQNQLQAAQPSQIQFDNVTITRDDNNYDDLITGIDLDLRNAAPGTVITLDVTTDNAGVKDSIMNFVDAYNSFRDFIQSNQQVDETGALDESVLFGDSLMEGVANTYTDILGQNFGLGGDIQTIRDLGITLSSNNGLTVDESALDAAILNNFDAVRAAFSSSGVSDNDEFALLSNDSSISSETIVFDITTDGAGTITGVSVGGDGSLFTIDGNSISGVEGGEYEGLTFSYQGLNSSTVTFQLNQGLADRLINSVDGYVNDIDGLIVQEKTLIQNENDRKSEEASEIISRAELFRASQIERYANLEAELQVLEVLKSQTRAILGNDDDN